MCSVHRRWNDMMNVRKHWRSITLRYLFYWQNQLFFRVQHQKREVLYISRIKEFILTFSLCKLNKHIIKGQTSPQPATLYLLYLLIFIFFSKIASWIFLTCLSKCFTIIIFSEHIGNKEVVIFRPCLLRSLHYSCNKVIIYLSLST